MAVWEASAGGWAVGLQDDGTVEEMSQEEAAAVRPGPEASMALALGGLPYPSVPGVEFGGSSVDVEPVDADRPGR